MSFVLPQAMRMVIHRRNYTNMLMEFVPQGESLAMWTNMVTIKAYRGLGTSPEPSAAIARMTFYPATCRIGPIYRDSGERIFASGLKVSILSIGCALLPAGAYPMALKGAGEQDFIMMFRDAETVYSLNYAERGALFTSKTPPPDPASVEVILKQVLGTATLSSCRAVKIAPQHIIAIGQYQRPHIGRRPRRLRDGNVPRAARWRWGGSVG